MPIFKFLGKNSTRDDTGAKKLRKRQPPVDLAGGTRIEEQYPAQSREAASVAPGISALSIAQESVWSDDATTLVSQADGVPIVYDAQSVASPPPTAPPPLQSSKPIDLGFRSEPSDAFVKPIEASDGDRRVASLPTGVWCRIADHLPGEDTAALALASKTLRHKLGGAPWEALRLPEKSRERLAFLHHLDRHVPDHLLCHLCLRYHRRTQPGRERLGVSMALSPPFVCPQRRLRPYPRARLAHGRELPYALVQLALRRHAYTPAYGPELAELARGWRCRDSPWAHQVRFFVRDDGRGRGGGRRLLMRVHSVAPAPPRMTPNQERLLLFSRTDYAPYFSACAHWDRYNLLPVCKCALSHVPLPPEGVAAQLRRGPSIDRARLNTHMRAKQCDECKPLRRCPECPTEYLVQLRLVEDARRGGSSAERFTQSICVTRWSDLGDGSGPAISREWAACAGDLVDFDSVGALGAAGIASVFEMAASGGAPGERLAWLRRGGIVNGRITDVY